MEEVGFSETLVHTTSHSSTVILDLQGSENVKLNKMVKVLLKEKQTCFFKKINFSNFCIRIFVVLDVCLYDTT
jgi:hypothetical protein